VINKTFKELKVAANILKVIEEMGYKRPTEIQEKAIPMLLESEQDFVGQAQTGTGKTAAFVIPLLQKIDFENPNVQALILTPTRELAGQVESEIKKLGKYTNISSTCIYGGTGYEKQIHALKHSKPQIVVGTPGRVLDLLKKRNLKLEKASYCVLDEADEMLNMGFFEDVQVILDKFKNKKQLMMFSATMPKAIINLINKSFNDHKVVKVEKKSLSNDDIDQKYFIVRDKHFKEALARLIDHAQDIYGIVFCRTKIETREVGDDLKKRGQSVEVLNGDMGQAERDLAMKNFKTKKVNIMVCTDVAARGIDVNNLTHVFNYGLPRDNESYVHRIGRTGRAGMKGKAFTIVGPRSANAIKNIEKHINKNVHLSKLPSVEDLKRNIVKKDMDNAQHILSAIKSKGKDFKTEASFELFEKQFGDLDQEELLKVMFTWKFNKDMRHYNNLADIESIPNNKPLKPKKRERGERKTNTTKVKKDSRASSARRKRR
jgi:ATP-dependent RNA helicase DeaD